MNKLDRTGADFFRCVDMIRDRLGAKQLVIQTEKDAKGKFGRVLGRLFADKININQSMIDNHLAVEYFGQSKEELEAGHMANRQILIDEKKINLDL